MKKKSMISIVVVSVFLLFGIPTVAWAGVDPEPFKNQLGAVENILTLANKRVVKVIANPPSDEPSSNVKDAVNRLEAINNQLVSADDMVRSIAEEVMGIDPEPFHPHIEIAFEGVRDAAQGIVQYIHDNPLSDEAPDQFRVAVEAVDFSAQAIVDFVEDCLTFVPAFPGTYAISLRWIDSNEEVHVRVGIYSFRNNGSFRADYWEWGSKDEGKPVHADIIGWGNPFDYKDYDKRVVTDDKFLSHELTTQFGSWKTYSLNTRVEINWENGTKEAWKLTWRDSTINKLEPYYLDAADAWRDFYLENPAISPDGGPYSPYFFQRNLAADNVGYALGCQRSFETFKQDTSYFQGIYWGWVFRRNYYGSGNGINQAKPWTLRLDPEYPEPSLELTTNDVWRDVHFEPVEWHYVFSYLDIPNEGNTGLKSGRVYMQVDHDSDDDLHIDDETGHIYLGFQVADMNDDVRGFVFAEASWDQAVDVQRYMQMSAMYLLDDGSTAAGIGFLPDPLL